MPPVIVSRRERWQAVGILSALTFIFAFPLPLRIASDVLPIGPDGNLILWTLAWNAYAVLHQPLALFDANIYYPFPNTLAYSENLLGTSLIAAPIQWLTGNLTLSLNVVTLLSVVLCGVGAYLLARRVGLDHAAALVAAIIFAFAPPRFFRLAQTHLAIHWLPFCLASLHAYFDAGRKRDLRLAVLFFTLQALTSGHGAVFLIVAGIVLLVYRLLRGTAFGPLRWLRDLGVTGLLLLTPVLLVQLPYWTAQRTAGLRRGLGNWGVNHISFLASPSHVWSALLALVPATEHINRTANAYLFPGAIALALAAAAVVRRRHLTNAHTREAVVLYALLFLLCYWLALGPPYGAWQFVYQVPGLNFIREVSRFTMLGMLALAILAGAAVQTLSASADRRRVAAGLAMLLLCVEFAAFPLRPAPSPINIPEADRWLARQPSPFVVAEVPLVHPDLMGPAGRRQTVYMFHAMAHWQKTVHGYSGIQQPMHTELYDMLLNFPDDRSLNRLQELGVTYVVVHGDLYPPAEWPGVEARLIHFRDRLTRVFLHGSDRVYRLAPPVAH